MRIVNRLALAFVASIGICAGAALAADAPAAPAQAPAAAAAPAATTPAKVVASDRWYSIVVNDEQTVGWVRITMKESGQADAPVLVTYEMNMLGAEGHAVTVKIDNLCLNDEWQSPVKINGSLSGEGAPPLGTVTIARPDPASTQGKATVVSPEGQKREWDVPEHTILFFAPVDLVTRMPFDKEKKQECSRMDPVGERVRPCTISYAGEEEININGAKQKVNKFVENPSTPHDESSTYWVNAKHELVKAEIQGAAVTPTTEAEAKKMVQTKDTAAPAAPEPPKREAVPGSAKETLK